MSEVSRAVGNGCRIPALKAGDMFLPLCGEEHSDPLGVRPHTHRLVALLFSGFHH